MFDSKLFVMRSGKASDFKIECDDLTDQDIESLAKLVAKKFKFKKVFGVPRGGLRLEQALLGYEDSNASDILIVDDVFSTGGAISSYIEEHDLQQENLKAVVIFSRGKCPDWIHPIFQLWNDQ